MDWIDELDGTQTATIRRMDTQNVTATEAPDMTEIEERIESQRQSAELMRQALDCECPDKACTVAHES